MKTLTEFPGMNLKNAAKIKSDLIAAGKTSEEIPQALGETLKLEGDRLNFLLTALEIIDKKLDDLKRAVVYTLGEGEKLASGLIQKGDHIFLVEYYPPLEKKKPSGGFQEGRPGGKRRGKKGKPRGGRGDHRREGRNPRPAPAETAMQKKEGTSSGENLQRKENHPSRPPKLPVPKSTASSV